MYTYFKTDLVPNVYCAIYLCSAALHPSFRAQYLIRVVCSYYTGQLLHAIEFSVMVHVILNLKFK